MEVYTFDKSLQERLIEFTEILCSRGETVPASRIHLEWSYYVELTIEPVGWQALWKIPRSVCQDFDIHYPTIVVGMIERVDFADLSALIKITAVQDEIHLPEKYDVPLTELYPTRDQENTALDMIGTANCIDQLRFFFNYLWMPWDVDDDDDADWVTAHLEPRIRLFFDMKRGVVDKETCDVVRTLIREGKEARQKISRLEATISDDEESQGDSLDDDKARQLMKLHFRIQQIKTEMEVLENPTMRDVLSRDLSPSAKDTRSKISEDRNKQIEAYFTWSGGSLEKMKEALDIMQTFLPPTVFLKTSASLEDSLRVCDVNSIVVLGEGNHRIRSAGGLEDGGTIKGLQNAEHTIISPKETESGPSVLDFSGDQVLLENLSVNVEDLQIGIIARKGTVKIIGCKIYASNRSTVNLGVVVLPGAKVILERTLFEGLGTAVVIYSSGEVTMDQCSFKDCAEGIQLQDNVNFVAKDCLLGYFKEYAIRLETQKYIDIAENKSGSAELLIGIVEVALRDCKFECNGKADVLVKARSTTHSH